MKDGDKRFTRFTVTKRLDAIIGQYAAEKRSRNWALTSFMREAWNSAKDELQIV